MIAWLSGKPRFIEGIDVVLDVSGVGYRVTCPPQTIEGLRHVDGASELFITSVTREDGTRLFGFSSTAERDWFSHLTSVQGVGGKVAIAALGVLGVDGLHRSVTGQDVASLRRVPGIGQKVAERVVVELRQKVGLTDDVAPKAVTASAILSDNRIDAVSALSNLGYSKSQIDGVIDQIVNNGFTETSDIVRSAIRQLASVA